MLAAREQIHDLEERLGIVRPANNGANGAVAPVLEDARDDNDGGGETGAPSTYTVVAGDTLTRISEKVYGGPDRWMDIYQANRDTLTGPNALRVGQVLRIP